MKKRVYNEEVKKNVLLVLIGMLAGVFLGRWLYYEKGYDAGINVCREKLSSIGLSQTKAEGTKAASGKILSISENKITFEMYPPADLLQDSSKPSSFTRVGIINDKTAVLSRSLDLERVRGVKPGGKPVSPFVEKSIPVSDLTSGTIVDVTADTDVVANKEFTVIKVVVNEKL